MSHFLYKPCKKKKKKEFNGYNLSHFYINYVKKKFNGYIFI